MNLAPIVLFTYKRLDVLRYTISALQKNDLASESILYIYSDGTKKKSDEKIVQEIRNYLKTITGFKKVLVIESAINKGLARSIISGVSEVIAVHKKVIVLEDDLITTVNFLLFMNNALERYENQARVCSISGYSFNLKPDNTCSLDAYFFNRGWSWGWATWEDRWKAVDWSVGTYDKFKLDTQARRRFAQGGSDLNSMLDKQMNGELDSWAIRWFYHQFITAGLTLYPVYSKINNEGWDENATHTTGSSRRYIPRLDPGIAKTFELPKNIILDSYYGKLFRQKMNVVSRLRSRIESFLVNLTR